MEAFLLHAMCGMELSSHFSPKASELKSREESTQTLHGKFSKDDENHSRDNILFCSWTVEHLSPPHTQHIAPSTTGWATTTSLRRNHNVAPSPNRSNASKEDCNSCQDANVSGEFFRGEYFFANEPREGRLIGIVNDAWARSSGVKGRNWSGGTTSSHGLCNDDAMIWEDDKRDDETKDGLTWEEEKKRERERLWASISEERWRVPMYKLLRFPCSFPSRKYMSSHYGPAFPWCQWQVIFTL